DPARQGDLPGGAGALAGRGEPPPGVIAPDALLCGDLPGRVHRGERGPQVIDAGEDRQRLLGGVRGGVRQRIAHRAGAGESEEGGAEDLREDTRAAGLASISARAEAAEVRTSAEDEAPPGRRDSSPGRSR